MKAEAKIVPPVPEEHMVQLTMTKREAGQVAALVNCVYGDVLDDVWNALADIDIPLYRFLVTDEKGKVPILTVKECRDA